MTAFPARPTAGQHISAIAGWPCRRSQHRFRPHSRATAMRPADDRYVCHRVADFPDATSPSGLKGCRASLIAVEKMRGTPHPSKLRWSLPGRIDVVAEGTVGLEGNGEHVAWCGVQFRPWPSNGAGMMPERRFAQMTFFGTSVPLSATVAAAEVPRALCMHT